MEWKTAAALGITSVLGAARLMLGWREWSREAEAGSDREPISHRLKQKSVWLCFFACLLPACLTLGFFYRRTGSLLPVCITDLAATYLILALVDAKKQVVPDSILLCFLAAQLCLGAAVQELSGLAAASLKGLLFALVLLALARISGGRMGMGDAKLLGVTAITAGCGYTVWVMCLAAIPVFLYSVGMLVFRRAQRKTEIPFVPFLALGVGMSLFL